MSPICYTPIVLEADYYDRLEDDKVRCRLCPHNCLIKAGKIGVCFIRRNRGGRLVPMTYGRVSSVQLDPIEKKPLHDFHPGTKILSIGSIGCNLGCPFCQNWQIAQPKDLIKKKMLPDEPDEVVSLATEPLEIEDLAGLAEKYRDSGNIGVAYTYNEPLIWFEYVRDAAQAIKKKDMFNVLVTNGFINEKPLKELLPLIDAMNIDIKGMSEELYRKMGGRLEPVLKTAALANESCHVEITNLLIPGLNTEPEQIGELVDWVADTLGADTTLHFSRYFPARRYTVEATHPADLELAREIASRRLRAVVLGNI